MRAALLLLASAPLLAADFRFEVTAFWWPVAAGGAIQSGVVPVDLERDLGITGYRSHFTGRLIAKPGRRHRVTVEGTPYRLDGDHVVSREIVFAGQAYQVQDRVVSHATIDSVTAAYEYEFLSTSRGHFAVGAGAGYVEATGTLRSVSFGFSAVEHQSFPLPLLQTSFRYRFVPRFYAGGETKGMTLGDYGYHFQAAAEAGLEIVNWLGITVGYRYVEADVHRRSGTRGVALQFHGPLIGLRFFH